MSQHPFNIADQSFPSMLTTLNQVAQALASSSSGTAEPSTTYPYQIWADTTNNLLKLRNGANNAWMTLAAFDATNNRWQPRFDVMQVLSSAGLTVKKSDGSAAILTLADDGTLDVPAIKKGGTALGAAALKGFTDNNDLSVDPGNVGTRGNMKAYADAASGWTESPLVPTTSGSVIDFASLPAGITEIQLLLNGMSYAANTTGLIQLGTGGVPQTTGYLSSASADYGSAFSSTEGFAIRAGSADGFYGVVDIKRADGNDWVESHSLGISVYPVFGGGGVTLTGELDFLRIKSSSSTFDAGSVKLRYR